MRPLGVWWLQRRHVAKKRQSASPRDESDAAVAPSRPKAKDVTFADAEPTDSNGSHQASANGSPALERLEIDPLDDELAPCDPELLKTLPATKLVLHRPRGLTVRDRIKRRANQLRSDAVVTKAVTALSTKSTKATDRGQSTKTKAPVAAAAVDITLFRPSRFKWDRQLLNLDV